MLTCAMICSQPDHDPIGLCRCPCHKVRTPMPRINPDVRRVGNVDVMITPGPYARKLRGPYD